jgi:hypothetical protein
MGRASGRACYQTEVVLIESDGLEAGGAAVASWSVRIDRVNRVHRVHRVMRVMKVMKDIGIMTKSEVLELVMLPCPSKRLW